MSPDDTFVSRVNAALADPDVRTSIVHMHREEWPLMKMIEDLGLEEGMPPDVKAIVEQLSPEVVAGIREATVEMLRSSTFEMPLQCQIPASQLKNGARVSVQQQDGRRTIAVSAIA